MFWDRNSSITVEKNLWARLASLLPKKKREENQLQQWDKQLRLTRLWENDPRTSQNWKLPKSSSFQMQTDFAFIHHAQQHRNSSTQLESREEGRATAQAVQDIPSMCKNNQTEPLISDGLIGGLINGEILSA